MTGKLQKRQKCWVSSVKRMLLMKVHLSTPYYLLGPAPAPCVYLYKGLVSEFQV